MADQFSHLTSGCDYGSKAKNDFIHKGNPSCRIPDDYIDSKRYPLFMARAVPKELIESLQSTRGVKPY